MDKSIQKNEKEKDAFSVPSQDFTDDSKDQNSEKTNANNGAFKSTLLFSFVKIVQIIVGVVKAKLAAILLGPEGVGILGIFNKSIDLTLAGAGLGVSQSCVRDVSEANGSNDRARFSRVISLTNKTICFTALLGFAIMFVFSRNFSFGMFGNDQYVVSYLILSTAVAIKILTEGQLAILTGMRQLRSLAKAAVIGSFVGLFVAIPLYFAFGKKGIVPSLVMINASALFFSNYFVRKIKYDRCRFTWREFFSESSAMIKMGVALMFVSFMVQLFDIVVAAFIRRYGGLDSYGLFEAGRVIMITYFGVVTTAMSTDYYPRVSAVNQDNSKVQEELSRQSNVGLLLVFPLAALFLLFSPLVITILYSKDFLATTSFTDLALFGTIISVSSRCMEIILVAKKALKIFFSAVLSFRILLLPIYLALFYYYGLKGLGYAFIANGILHMAIMSGMLRYFYGIKLKSTTVKHFVVIFTTLIGILIFRSSFNIIFGYALGVLLLLFAIAYSYYHLVIVMKIDLVRMLKKRGKRS